jgi:hypothetical protein
MYAQAGCGLGVGGIGDGIGGSLGTLVLSGFRKQGKAKGGSEAGRASRKQRSSYDGSVSFTTISSYDGDTATISATPDFNEPESKVEAWLQRGKSQAPLSDSGSTSQPSTQQPSMPPTTRHALSIFPPTSPKTGRREYLPPTAPVSPMNNGRDAYGNHIPTNIRDYGTAQSSVSSPILCPIAEEMTSHSMSMPYMRGGGGWWNPLNTGKELSMTEQPNTPWRPELPQRRNPGHSYRETFTMGHPASHTRLDEGSSQAIGSMRAATSTEDRARVAIDDWSDESDHDERLFKPNIGGQSLIQQSTLYSNTELTVVARFHDKSYGLLAALAKENHLPSRDSISTLDTELDPESRRFLATIERPVSPFSEISFDPRAHKRWNQGPATPPPGQAAVPPPPPPKPAKSMSAVNSAIGMSSIAKHRYDYPQSVAQSYDGDTYDLQSLRSLELGESISVAGRPRRQNDFAARRQGIQVTRKEYEAIQRAVQVEFRPLCQDVMSRYNADMSRTRRAYESDHISAEQHKVQVEFNEKNKMNALKHSADQSGYVVSVQPWRSHLMNTLLVSHM